IRYAGTDTALVVPALSMGSQSGAAANRKTCGCQATQQVSRAALQAAFEAAHKSRFGFIDPSKALVIEAVSIEAIGGGAKFSEPVFDLASGPTPPPARSSRFCSGGTWRDASIFLRHQLSPGHNLRGPAIIIEPHQTVVVEEGWEAAITAKNHLVIERVVLRHPLPPGHNLRGPAIIIEPHQTVVVEEGWEAAITAKNHLVIERVVPLKRESAIGTAADPVMLEVFNNLFMSIAEQMGVSLQNTAYSVNIKERLDFSCAIFAADSTLVANAPHMPVHLGSMDRAVETVIRENQGAIAPGDVYVINAPYNGGTHLPDI